MTRMPFPDIKNSIDRVIHAIEGRHTNGLSPASLTLAYMDWLIHTSHSPGKLNELLENILRKSSAFGLWAARASLDSNAAPFIQSLPGDRRFNDPAWKRFPYNVMAQGFLLQEQWWHYATTGIPGVAKHHENVVSFAARQCLDLFSPTNYPFTNPTVVEKAISTGGQSLAKGMQNLMEDLQHSLLEDKNPDDQPFVVGKQLACTPGKVIFRNRLIELIQYSPTTDKVAAEPILITPAWIMKYYILDLSEHNSMVRYLVDKGHTVFMISWHNPDARDRDMGMSDYLNLGVMDALKAINAVLPERKVHLVGYCLGGTLATIAAAAMSRDNDDRLQSLTMFTAQTDFTEAGELMLFIDESQLTYMEDIMWDKGYLDTQQMAGAFTLLRSYDLIWSRIVSEYLLGESPRVNDLMTWNADSTRMPYKMHSEYLRHLFLNNDLASGRFPVGERPISLRDIRVPVFCVATQTDHVAPWRSVYKVHDLMNTEVTFALTSGGHNAGIVSEPGHPRRSYQLGVQTPEDKHIPADDWLLRHDSRDGSWWEPWSDWLTQHSTGQIKPPAMGNADAGYPVIAPAPGTYVFER
ncbi:polyhydroxyalkanoate synthase [Marinobacterium halophilum]|uniref:Polyhydroxyalkanoate synthase n=1 Tax=Marinobacterium halophilum TaxID=267374 RepID=A0A2P8F0E5_9GAMM|nr:alpha/beta fold hydrolase [Marinobacterium halophilum]PSL15199.1 polyhydroxyalkanoate synthase [Marinobacterium halophilum]